MNAAKLIKVFRARQKLYQSDPVLFAKEVVGYEADVWQADTLRDLADPDCRRVSVRSGQGVGKTATEAVALLWFLSCFPFARVVATAPTRQQLNDVLWSEIAKWQAKSPKDAEPLFLRTFYAVNEHSRKAHVYTESLDELNKIASKKAQRYHAKYSFTPAPILTPSANLIRTLKRRKGFSNATRNNIEVQRTAVCRA